MAYINKVTVRGRTYNLENLTDGTHIVRLPTLSGDDVFVTEKTLQTGVKASELTDGTHTVSLPKNLTKDDTFVLQSVQDKVNDNKVDKVSGKGSSTNDYTTPEKNKLSGIEDGANKYTHPIYNTRVSGLYKITVDSTGHVSDVSEVTKDDITGLGITDGTDAVNQANAYTDKAISEYKPYSIKVVPTLPESGEDRTFYLVPNESKTGYTKYWWITDNGEQKWDEFKGASTVVVTKLPTTGEKGTDYILYSDAGCFYYKWIDNEWKMVAGTVAHIVNELPDRKRIFRLLCEKHRWFICTLLLY